jgi:hypothetical protein
MPVIDTEIFQRIQYNAPTITTVRSADCSGRRDVTIETPVCLLTTRNYTVTINTQKGKQNKYDKVEQQAVTNPLFPETEHHFLWD